MTDEVSTEEWQEYLQELYEWITLRYEKFQRGDINESVYLKEYKHYEEETSKINLILEKRKQQSIEVNMDEFRNELTTSLKPVPPENLPVKKKTKIKPDIIESFFFGDKTEVASDPKVKKWRQKSLSNLSQIAGKVPPQQVQLQNDTTKEHSALPTNFKIALLGDSSVGRTSLRRRFMGKNFVEQHLSTVGASIESRDIDDTKISLYDLGGQDFYASVRTSFYRNINGALIVFDVSKRETFMNIDKWIYELFNNISNKTVPFLLVGNKTDKRRVVQKKEGEKLAERLSVQTAKLGFKVEYIETSAKNQTNVEESILRLVEIIKQVQNH